MVYLRNCWYMAGWADELDGGAVLARRLLGEPVILFRDGDGRINGLSDRCPHRFAPLSKGRRIGDAIECGYHGLQFGSGGICVANPHGPISANLKVRAYPAEEAFGGLWIWMGDPERADPSLIPDMSYLLGCPETAFSKGYLHAEGHYELFVDNILDLSHVDYLHPGSLGGGSMTRSRAEVKEQGRRLSVTWKAFNEPPTPLMKSLMDSETVDVLMEVTWSAPGVMRLSNSTAPAGGAEEERLSFHNCHVVTPETETSTHYFFASTRNFLTQDVEVNDKIAHLRRHVFSTEDIPMIAAQHDRMGGAEFFSLRPLLFRIDEGPVKARRILQQAISAEQDGTDSGSL